MLLDDIQMGEIVEQLLQTTTRERLDWHREGDRLLVGLPNQTTIELAANAKSPAIVIEVRGPAGVVFGHAEKPNSDESPAGKLYKAATEQATKSVFAEIISSIQFSDSATAEVVRPSPRINADQVVRVLQRMEGQWRLDFSRGTERVKVNKSGEYFVSERSEPAFHLKVLAWNEQTSTAEIAKDRADGRRVQIEHLTISPDAMIGYAKHDGHKLHYRRV
jgi:hypothetical protein